MAQTFNLGNATNPRDFNIDNGSLLFANGANVAYGTTLPSTGTLGQVFFMQSDKVEEEQVAGEGRITGLFQAERNGTGGNQLIIKNSAYREASIVFTPTVDETKTNWWFGTGIAAESGDDIIFYNSEIVDSSKYSKSAWTSGHTGVWSPGTILRISPKGRMYLTKRQSGGDNIAGDVYYEANGYFSGTYNGAARSATTTVRFGVGTGGMNRGIYDEVEGNWLINRNTTKGQLASGGTTLHTVSGSDIRLKTDINDLSVKDFYLNLKPKTFKYKKEYEPSDAQRTRYGLIAQDVIENLKNSKLNFEEYNLITKFAKADLPSDAQTLFKEEDECAYFINYQEFHGMHIQMIQDAYKEIEQLKEEIKLLKEKLGD